MDYKHLNQLLREMSSDYTLKDCELVIDAHNYFYKAYQESGLPSKAGCQSDNYAMYLKENKLKMFTEANVKCYFLFKGGSKNLAQKFEKRAADNQNIVSPILRKSICKQVLDEMGFEYVTCLLECKQQCAILANELGCPTLSNDREFATISNMYINYNDLAFDPEKNVIKCKLFKINNVLNNIRLTRKNEILQKQLELRTLRAQSSPGIPYQYFRDRNTTLVQQMDSQWFEKGVAHRFIATPYIDLYRDGIIEGCWMFNSDTKPDAILLSIDIVKYAFNLLTNYSRDTFKIRTYNNEEIPIDSSMPDVPKPSYQCTDVVFNNGWENIRDNQLFEHFITKSIKGIDLDILKELPKEARLLMITLMYVAHKSDEWGAREAFSVLMSLLALGNDNIVSESERCAVESALAPFKQSEPDDYCTETVYTLLQFQHCLDQMNHLNALCGYPYAPTIYSKTYNGNLVYNILTELKKTTTNAEHTISRLLYSAPETVEYLRARIANIQFHTSLTE